MYVLDELGRLQRWNKNLEIVGGYPVDQLIEMKVLDFIAPEDKTSVIQALEKVFLEGTASVEAKICINGGQLIPYF